LSRKRRFLGAIPACPQQTQKHLGRTANVQTQKIAKEIAATCLAAGLSVLLATAAAAHGSSGPKEPKISPFTIKKQGYFYAGGGYTADQHHWVGQMYVEYQIPEKQTSKYPIIMIHGGGLTGTNYIGTPDNRWGWRDYFVSRGWPVYVVDQPARGRSAWTTEEDYGPIRAPASAAGTESSYGRESNWPGTGLRGDFAFDQFMASLDSGMANNRAPQEAFTNGALVDLLDKIGPAVVLVHSQSGVNGWHSVDQRPNLVKALIAVEPYGPPFQGIPYGITSTPLKFSPPVTDPAQFQIVQQTTPNFPGAILCQLQKPPAAFKLPSMANSKAKILIVSSAEGARRNSDHCSKLFLEQAGVNDIEHVKLADVGILGHGHMMMVEKNNLMIAELMEKWLRKRLSLSNGNHDHDDDDDDHHHGH
jgi:pimeloyl-ACP methyl ester carboxylesterase